jgi:phage terminase large subunit GpA-like protein
MITDGQLIYIKSFADGLRPEPELWIDEWSEKYAVIPAENGAEPGKYNIERTPYAREIMRALSPAHPAKKVVCMVASQMFKTQVALNFMMACIDSQPANFLVVMPSGNLAKRLSNRISNTINATPKVINKIARPRSRDGRNTLDTKEFTGGALFITTSGSARNLAEIPARYVYCDEVDGWELNIQKEGDPIKIVLARTSTYGKRAKLYFTSTPKLEGFSKIHEMYLEGNQCILEVECPDCGHYHQLLNENLNYSKSTDGIINKAWMKCPACLYEIHESEKTKLIKSGKFRETAKGDGETWSCQVSALYAPVGWVSWLELAREYSAAKELYDKNMTEAMQVYVNTRLALPFKSSGSETSAIALRERAEAYKLRTVQAGGCVLTCGVDVQGNRLEAMVLAWGRNFECWIVDYHVIIGSPVEQDTWNDLKEYINKPFQHELGGELMIQKTLIDTGFSTHDVYNFVRENKKNVLAIKGSSRPSRPIISSKPSKQDVRRNGKVDVKGVDKWEIGTDTAKEYFWQRWHLKSGAGAYHFSKDLPIAFFEGLTAETRRIVIKKGKPSIVWEDDRTVRNEPLDLSVYNLAAAYHLGLYKFTDNEWKNEEQKRLKETKKVNDKKNLWL